MPAVVVYTTRLCPYCVMARRLLTAKGVVFEEIRVDAEHGRREEMRRLSGGRWTVPQVFIGGQHVGGYDDLADLERRGELDTLLRGG